jgi:hypothetical protein
VKQSRKLTLDGVIYIDRASATKQTQSPFEETLIFAAGTVSPNLLMMNEKLERK